MDGERESQRGGHTIALVEEIRFDSRQLTAERFHATCRGSHKQREREREERDKKKRVRRKEHEREIERRGRGEKSR